MSDMADRDIPAQGEPKNDDDRSVAEKTIQHLQRFTGSCQGPRPPTSLYHRPNRPCESLKLLSKVKAKYGSLAFICGPDEAEEQAETETATGKHDLVPNAYRLFYAEWDYFMGPDPKEPIAPATDFVRDEEAMRFMMLFPYGTGHYAGPTGHPTPLTFEEYALYRLQLADTRFQKDFEWLRWVLTRTEDRGLVKVVNCCLATLHRCKARHLGKGKVEVLKVTQDFGVRELSSDGILLPV